MIWKLASVLLLLSTAAKGQDGNELTITVTALMSQVFVDGVMQNISNGGDWQQEDRFPISDNARLIAVQGLNLFEGCSGIMAAVRGSAHGYTTVSDRLWKCFPGNDMGWQNLGFDDSNWVPAHEIGANGVVPGCSWVPLPAYPTHAQWIWSESHIGGDPVMHCRGYTPVCSFVECQNGGTCELNRPNICTCPVRFTGEFCETAFSECGSNPCLNGGQCEETDFGYECRCPIGSTGTHCETDITDCASDPCQNAGTCIFDVEGGYSCSCATGYTGDHCETLIDYCESEPCQNGGSCNSVAGGFTCACPAGYTGVFCQFTINYCLSNPCMNAATCVPGVNMYECRCHPGYIGDLCEIGQGECATNPCFNGGTCTLGGPGGEVECVCPEGFFGQHCEFTVDFCANNPCHNGATCVVEVGGFHCVCPPAYNGSDCNSVIPNCGDIAYQSTYDPVRNFWSLCEINIIDHAAYVNTPCNELIVGINHYDNAQAIIDAGGTFGCFRTPYPEDMPNACVRHYAQNATLAECRSCTHMAFCIEVLPLPTPGV